MDAKNALAGRADQEIKGFSPHIFFVPFSGPRDQDRDPQLLFQPMKEAKPHGA
ncbi:MAG: hypothetical protein WA871_14145 [Candidatus Acidiferrales bacterium]